MSAQSKLHQPMAEKAHNFYFSVKEFINKLVEFTRRYPIPTLATLGLLVGASFHWPLNQSAIGQWIWLATLIGGGAPIVWDTSRGILRNILHLI